MGARIGIRVVLVNVHINSTTETSEINEWIGKRTRKSFSHGCEGKARHLDAYLNAARNIQLRPAVM